MFRGRRSAGGELASSEVPGGREAGRTPDSRWLSSAQAPEAASLRHALQAGGAAARVQGELRAGLRRAYGPTLTFSARGPFGP
jgi:hypothetical protein